MKETNLQQNVDTKRNIGGQYYLVEFKNIPVDALFYQKGIKY